MTKLRSISEFLQTIIQYVKNKKKQFLCPGYDSSFLASVSTKFWNKNVSGEFNSKIFRKK